MDIARKLKMRCLIEWREVLVWREKGWEENEKRDRESRLDKEDVTNLQFTRYRNLFASHTFVGS